MDNLIKLVGKVIVMTVVILLTVSVLINVIAYVTITERIDTEVAPLVASIASNNYMTPEMGILYMGDSQGKYNPNTVEYNESIFGKMVNSYIRGVSIDNWSVVSARNGRNEGDAVQLIIRVDTNFVLWTMQGRQLTSNSMTFRYNIPCIRYYKS